jgi:hypothetical protein
MSTGWESRLAILRGEVEQKILTPLRQHSWTIHDTREVEHGEYIVLDAERAGHRHKVGVLYSSATRNDVYKVLAGEVEHIFTHGQLYKLDSYAYGISVPIGTLDDFHQLLLTWNAASAPGKFAPGSDNVIEAKPPKHRTLLAEAPIEAIWLRLRQLGSVTLARKLVASRGHDLGVELDGPTLSGKAEGLAYALRNAIDYYQASERPNVSQRVLNLYYGTLAFAFAEMLADPNGARTLAEIEDATKQGHGLYTIDGTTSDLEQLVVGVIASGFFPTWMKAMGLPVNNFPTKKPRKFDDLTAMGPDAWLTIEQLFARIPEIADLFADIFASKPAWVTPAYDQQANPGPSFFGKPKAKPTSTYALLLDDSARLTKEDVASFPGPISEIKEVAAEGGGRHFQVAVNHSGKDLWWDALPVHHSPFERTALIRPIFGTVGEYRAICLVLLYALSIIVRYRPSVWRRVQEGDLDHLRVLIEAFLAVVERVLPEQFLEQVTGQKFFVKQPGSFF